MRRFQPRFTEERVVEGEAAEAASGDGHERFTYLAGEAGGALGGRYRSDFGGGGVVKLGGGGVHLAAAARRGLERPVLFGCGTSLQWRKDLAGSARARGVVNDDLYLTDVVARTLTGIYPGLGERRTRGLGGIGGRSDFNLRVAEDLERTRVDSAEADARRAAEAGAENRHGRGRTLPPTGGAGAGNGGERACFAAIDVLERRGGAGCAGLAIGNRDDDLDGACAVLWWRRTRWQRVARRREHDGQRGVAEHVDGTCRRVPGADLHAAHIGAAGPFEPAAGDLAALAARRCAGARGERCDGRPARLGAIATEVIGEPRRAAGAAHSWRAQSRGHVVACGGGKDLAAVEAIDVVVAFGDVVERSAVRSWVRRDRIQEWAGEADARGGGGVRPARWRGVDEGEHCRPNRTGRRGASGRHPAVGRVVFA